MTFVVIFIFVAGLYYWFITERQIKELKNHSSTNNKEPNDNTDVNINNVEIDTNENNSEDDGIYDQSTRHAQNVIAAALSKEAPTPAATLTSESSTTTAPAPAPTSTPTLTTPSQTTISSSFDEQQWNSVVSENISTIKNIIELYQKQNNTIVEQEFEFEPNTARKIAWTKILNNGLPIAAKATRLYQAYDQAVSSIKQAIVRRQIIQSSKNSDNTKAGDPGYYIKQRHSYKSLNYEASKILSIYDEFRELNRAGKKLVIEIDSTTKITTKQGYNVPELVCQLNNDLSKISEFYKEKYINKLKYEELYDLSQDWPELDSDSPSGIYYFFKETSYYQKYTEQIISNNTTDRMQLCHNEWIKLINECNQFLDKANDLRLELMLETKSCGRSIKYNYDDSDHPLTLETLLSAEEELEQLYNTFNKFEYTSEPAELCLCKINALMGIQDKLEPNSDIPNGETVQKTIDDLKAISSFASTTVPNINDQIAELRLKFFILNFTLK